MESIFSAALSAALVTMAFTAQAQTGVASAALESLKANVAAGSAAGTAWCQSKPGCVGGSTQFNDTAGKPMRFLFGYPDASINVTADIGAWVKTGVDVSVVNVRGVGTRFHLNNVTEPSQCYVEYQQPKGFKKSPIIDSVSTGCGPLPSPVGWNMFSSPQSAVYALNNSNSKLFPENVASRMYGGGHAQTWDGRVFLRGIGYDSRLHWHANTFRPERIKRTPDGKIDFGGWESPTSTVGKSYIVEIDSAVSGTTSVPRIPGAPGAAFTYWNAIVPDDKVGGVNPYWSDEFGNRDKFGRYKTYKAIVYHTVYAGQNYPDAREINQLGFRKATIIVSEAETANANVASFKFTTPFTPLKTASGVELRCIEPTVTADGRLIMCQGNQNSDRVMGRAVYSWNETPNNPSGWTPLKSITNLYHERGTLVAGIPLHKRFPIAEFPIRNAKGEELPRGLDVDAAYPWLSLDGSELFYVNNSGGAGSTTVVVGRWTGGQLRNIDGPINPGRAKTGSFISSPGAFTTMWSPYKNVADLKIPAFTRGPAYPIFSSSSQSYFEVDFEGFLNGNYVLHLSMNEMLGANGHFDIKSTPDTSGYLNYAKLVNAQFPFEFNKNPGMVGRFGQAIHFPPNSYLDVTKARGWNTFKTGLSLEFWLKKEVASQMPKDPSGSDFRAPVMVINPLDISADVPLFQAPGVLNLSLVSGSQLKVTVTDALGKTDILSSAGKADLSGEWNHVALTLNASKSRLTLWVNGKEVASRAMTTKVAALNMAGAPVYVGPKDANAQLIIDELKLSNVAREAWEIAYSANVSTHNPVSEELANAVRVPPHLKAAIPHASGLKGFNADAINLGKALFHDPVLSRNSQTACASCHQAGRAFTDGLPTARSNEPQGVGSRNSPMLFNRMFSSFQGWSGSAESLFDQPLVPLNASHELNLPMAEVVQRLAGSPGYAKAFDAAFKQKPNSENVRAALGSFMISQFSPPNLVDSYLLGNRAALSDDQLRGMALFNGKARCVGCHSGVNYTDESFRSSVFAPAKDIGRAEVSKRDRDFKLFKVPSLRSVAATAPYMHDGSFANLEAVVRAYNDGAPGVRNPDTDIRKLELSDTEIKDLVEFLKAL